MDADRQAYESQLDKAAETMAACGVVILRNVNRPAHVTKMRDDAASRLKVYLEHELSPQQYPRLDCKACESHNVSQRSEGRWELKVPFASPWTDDETFNNLAVRGVLRRLVGRIEESRLEIDTYSVVTSLGKTPNQRWHADVDPFTRSEDYKGGNVVHLPPNGFVNFIPLEDVPLEMGPTEFLLKSHLQCSSIDKSSNREEPFEQNCKYAEKAGKWHASAKSGDTIIFDLRTHHRGGENRAKRNRPQVYLTFFREAYIDAVNFQKFQTRAFDAMAQGAKKRFSRVDQLACVTVLAPLPTASSWATSPPLPPPGPFEIPDRAQLHPATRERTLCVEGRGVREESAVRAHQAKVLQQDRLHGIEGRARGRGVKKSILRELLLASVLDYHCASARCTAECARPRANLSALCFDLRFVSMHEHGSILCM